MNDTPLEMPRYDILEEDRSYTITNPYNVILGITNSRADTWILNQWIKHFKDKDVPYSLMFNEIKKLKEIFIQRTVIKEAYDYRMGKRP